MTVAAAVILFSHGSLLCGAGQALEAHARNIRARNQFLAVEVGYLNYSNPPIEQAVAQCRAAGALRIVVVPYFLVAGKFVHTDLPRRLKSILAQNADLELLTARAMEDHALMTELVREALTAAEDPREWLGRNLIEARQNCEMRESCPLYGSEMCRGGQQGQSESKAGQEERETQAEDADATEISDVPSGRGVLMILHGSPRPEANAPAIECAQELRMNGDYARVSVAYLECNEPSIQTALAEMANAGITRLDVVPYFLHQGRHLVLDIGNALTAAQVEFPQMQIFACPAIGELARTSEVLADRAAEALPAGS